MIETIENILIIISRYFLIIIGALALIGAVIVLIYSLSLIIDSPNTSKGSPSKITYNEKYKSSLFPKPKTTLNEIQSNAKNSLSNPAEENQTIVSKRFIDLRDEISKQFNDSQENINKFYANLTPRTLELFFNNNYSYLGVNDNANLVIGMTNFFEEIGSIDDFKRIGNFDSRYELVLKTIDMYIDDFEENISIREAKIQANIRNSAAKNARGYANLINVLYGLALYAAAVLYLMIFKVEINLRRIPPAIRDED